MKFCTGFVWIDPTHHVELARTADVCGWDGIVLPDHLVHPERIHSRYPYSEDGALPWQPHDPFPDVWVSIAAMAAVTRRIRFYSGVYIVPLRDPFSLAKALGTAALLSGNRVVLGVGLGWMKEEFDLVGECFESRAERTEEMIEVMRRLWSGEMVEHHGRHYDFARLQMSPGIGAEVPIFVGGRSEAALRRVARIGDGWIAPLLSVAEFAEYIARIEAYRCEVGRRDAPLEVIGATRDGFDIDTYRRMEDVGVTHLWTIPWLVYGADAGSLRAKCDALERFADEVIAKMR